MLVKRLQSLGLNIQLHLFDAGHVDCLGSSVGWFVETRSSDSRTCGRVVLLFYDDSATDDGWANAGHDLRGDLFLGS